IESEHREPDVIEAAGEQVRPRLLGHRETAGHDHAAAVGSGVEPGCALGAAAGKAHLLPGPGRDSGAGQPLPFCHLDFLRSQEDAYEQAHRGTGPHVVTETGEIWLPRGASCSPAASTGPWACVSDRCRATATAGAASG